jgi:membrane-associated protease RseP (regulator of RpoE activity)
MTRGIGNSARLDVIRKGHRLIVPVALRAAPPVGKDDLRNLSGVHPLDGARVANILPATADELGLEDQEGVVIVAVKEESTAARLGFRTGDVIVQVGHKRIETVVELEAALKARQQLWQIALKRGDQVIQFQVQG